MEKFRREHREHIQAIFEEKTGVKLNGTARKPQRVQTAIAAACVCAALLGAVYAVEAATRPWVTDFYHNRHIEWSDGRDGTYDGYAIYGGVELIPVDSMPENVIAFAQKHANVKAGYISLAHESLDAAEAYLGLNIQDNPVLQELSKRYDHHTPHIKKGAHCVMWMAPSEDGPICFYVSAYYSWIGPEDGTVFIDVTENLYTDLLPYSPDETGGGPLFHAGADFEQTEYVTPSGLETVIVRVTPDREDEVNKNVLYQAYFSRNGARFEVEARSGSEEDNPEQALEILQQVLDGFS